MNGTIEYIRAITRPIVTAMLVLGWIAMILNETAYPIAYEVATLGMLAWWSTDVSLQYRAQRQAMKKGEGKNG